MVRIIKSSLRRKKVKKNLRPLVLPLTLLASALALSAYIIVKGIPQLMPESENGVSMILSISPAFGPTGTRVTLKGSYFEEESIVVFGTDNEMPGLIAPDEVAKNGERLKFTVPASLDFCPPGTEENNIPCSLASPRVEPGNYTVKIQTPQGISDSVNFSVVGE